MSLVKFFNQLLCSHIWCVYHGVTISSCAISRFNLICEKCGKEKREERDGILTFSQCEKIASSNGWKIADAFRKECVKSPEKK